MSSLLQQVEISSDLTAFAAAKSAGAYGLVSMPQVETLQPVPPREPYSEVGQLGFIPAEVFTSHDPGVEKDYLRGEVAQARATAEREAQISRDLGVEVKIAFDPNTGEQVVLKPGEAGYDTLRGARANYAAIRYDLQKMGQTLSDFADLLPSRA